MKIDLKKFLIIISVIIILLGIIIFGLYKYFSATDKVNPLPAEIKADTTTNTTTNTITNNIVSNAFATEEAVDGELDLENNMATTMKVLVVGAEDNHLKVAGITESNRVDELDLLTVSIPEGTDIEFKRGQEVLVYYNGLIAATFPGQVNAGKIEVIKEESDIEIPKLVLKTFYSKTNNVDINISEITNKGIIFTIIDANDIPFDYPNDYRINKEVKNPDYTGEGEYIGEATAWSTQGYTRNRFRIY